MNILYHHRTQGRGAEAIHIKGICTGLTELGFEVIVVGPPGVHNNPDAIPTKGKSTLARLLGWISRRSPEWLFEVFGMAYNLITIPRLLKRSKESRPKLLYERYSFYNACSVVVGALTHTPVVLEINDTVGVPCIRQGKKVAMPRLAAWFERQIFARATGLAAVSNYLRDQLLAIGVPEGKICVNPNAVDIQTFAPDTVDSGEIRRRYGLADNVVIGYCGAFVPWHQVQLLIRAFATLPGAFPNARLLLVGGGVDMAPCVALTQSLGLGERVVFTGPIPHAEVPAHIGAMDIGALADSNEFGSPMKVVEYMAMGCVPVAPRYGPLKELIESGANGMLFEPSNVSDLTGCLETLLSDRSFRSRLGAAARSSVIERHLWRHNAERVLGLVPGLTAPAAALQASEQRENALST